MILLVGQVGTDMIGREAFQEVDYRAYFGPLAKWVTQIDDVDRIPEILHRAWTTAISGRPGPVVIALPENMLTDISDVPALTQATHVQEPAAQHSAIEEMTAMLGQSKRPLAIVGGGGWTDQGRNDLQTFVEAHDIPVLAAFRFQDLFDNTHRCYAGDAGVGMTPAIKALIAEADLILAINIRFGEMTTDGYTALSVPNPAQTLVHTHISDRELGKIYQPNLAVHAGPNSVVASLKDAAPQGKWTEWRAKARAQYEAAFDLPAQPGDLDMGAVMAHLRESAADNAVLTNGAGNFAVWLNRFFKFGPDHRLLAPQSGAMGFGVPAAIAAKVAAPDRQVICVAGDGDFQMNCNELGTAMQANAQPIILIVNNGTYGTIRMHQEKTYPARVAGTTLENPDFSALARAYGFHAERITRTEDFPAAFERAVASDTGAVLDLVVSQEALSPRQTLSQMRAAGQAK